MFTGIGYFPALIHPGFVDNSVEIVKNSAGLGLFLPSLTVELWINRMNIQERFGLRKSVSIYFCPALPEGA